MKVPILVCAAAAALAASAGVASAHCRPHHHRAVYVSRSYPQHRYLRRTVVVRERVWRPAVRRVVYDSPEPVRVYRYAAYAPPVEAYDDGYGYGYGPRYVTVRGDGWRGGGWRHGWRRCHHRRWDD
jgi:hypothetical protein